MANTTQPAPHHNTVVQMVPNNPGVVVSSVAYKCFLPQDQMAVDGIPSLGYSNGVATPASTIISTSQVQPIFAELRALDTASILDTAIHADAALSAVISEQTRAGLSTTLRYTLDGRC